MHKLRVFTRNVAPNMALTIGMVDDALAICALTSAYEQRDPLGIPYEIRLRHNQEIKMDSGTYIRSVARQVLGLIDGSYRGRLKINQLGTPFQKRVWDTLRHTQRGELLSYSELAQRIGHPHAYRAVASACAANNCAIVVPCHRVIHADGRVTGYRWGDRVKHHLLHQEGSVPNQED